MYVGDESNEPRTSLHNNNQDNPSCSRLCLTITWVNYWNKNGVTWIRAKMCPLSLSFSYHVFLHPHHHSKFIISNLESLGERGGGLNSSLGFYMTYVGN